MKTLLVITEKNVADLFIIDEDLSRFKNAQLESMEGDDSLHNELVEYLFDPTNGEPKIEMQSLNDGNPVKLEGKFVIVRLN